MPRNKIRGPVAAILFAGRQNPIAGTRGPRPRPYIQGMAIRPAAPDDDGETFDDDFPEERPGPPVTEKEWRVDRRMTIVKFGLAVLFALLATVIRTTPAGRVLALVAMLATLLWALRDVTTPLRLAADQEGVTVLSGLRTYRRIPWSEIERVRLEPRPRFGGRLLEVDAGESLHFYGRYDLGEPPADALDTLTAIRPASN